MKIDKTHYPLIDYATRHSAMNEDLFRMALYTKISMSKHKGEQEFFPEYRQFIDDLANTPEIKTYLIAETVSKYLFDHSEPIMTKLWGFLPDIPDQMGAILWHGYTYFYRKFNEGEEAVILYMVTEGEKAEVGAVIKDRDGKSMVRGTPPDQSKASAVGFTMSTLVLPFLCFAQCETKIINSEATRKTKVNREKYITNIPSNIEIVDSNWFTTIIRTEGFGVTGHFRLQPIGSGRHERKLIWIKDFEKHGYTKRARIAIHEDE